MPEIRPLAEPDLTALWELISCSYSTAPCSRENVRADLANPDHLAMGYIEDEVLIACARAELMAGVWHVTDVCTRPEHRARGAASLALDELLARLRQIGDQMGSTLELDAENEPARRLYVARSFRDAGIRRAYYPNGADAIVMWRPPASVIDAGGASTWEPDV